MPHNIQTRLLTAGLGLVCLSSHAQQNEGAPQLEEVIVTGRAQQYYLEQTTSTGSKINIDIINLPQSVQVLSEQLMLDQAAREITDMYRSIAGVSEFSYSGVTVRGFRESDNVFYDGVRGDPYAGFSVPQLFNIERIDVLMGPSASLYGGGDPGGMINYVTKKPSFDQQIELTATTGNYDLFGGSLNANGALTDDLAGRIGMFYEQQDSFRDNADMKNTHITSGLLYEPGPDTALTLAVEYIDQDLGGHRLRGVFGRDDGSFIVDREYNTNEEDDYQTLKGWIGQLNLQQRFSSSFNMNATLRYLDNERNQGYHEPTGWDDVNGDGEANEYDGEIKRNYRLQERANQEYSITVDLVKTFATANWQHTLLVGGDYHDVSADFTSELGFNKVSGVPNLNVFQPSYGEADPSSYLLFDLGFAGADSQISGLYVQDLIEFNSQWSLMLGLRYDDYEDKDRASGFSYSDDNTSGRVGLVYKPMEDGAIYLNYSESFRPVGLADQQDPDTTGSLTPESGKQWELGWKQNWLDGQLRSTVAIYTISKEDVPQPNPEDDGPDDGIPALVNLGAVDSDGVELTLVGDITDRWTMTANYAYNDTVIVEGSSISNAFGDGDAFANAPRHQTGLWTRYDLVAINSAIAFGASHVSKQYNLDGQKVDTFTVYDASWTTTWDRLILQLNISNIFDEEYFVSGFSERTGNFPGAPREYVVQLRYTL